MKNHFEGTKWSYWYWYPNSTNKLVEHYTICCFPSIVCIFLSHLCIIWYNNFWYNICDVYDLNRQLYFSDVLVARDQIVYGLIDARYWKMMHCQCVNTIFGYMIVCKVTKLWPRPMAIHIYLNCMKQISISLLILSSIHG